MLPDSFKAAVLDIVKTADLVQYNQRMRRSGYPLFVSYSPKAWVQALVKAELGEVS